MNKDKIQEKEYILLSKKFFEEYKNIEKMIDLIKRRLSYMELNEISYSRYRNITQFSQKGHEEEKTLLLENLKKYIQLREMKRSVLAEAPLNYKEKNVLVETFFSEVQQINKIITRLNLSKSSYFILKRNALITLGLFIKISNL